MLGNAAFRLHLMLLLSAWTDFHVILYAVACMPHQHRRRWIRSAYMKALVHARGLAMCPAVNDLAVMQGSLLEKEWKQRGVWMKTRPNDWWDRIVAAEFTDEDWRDNFKMSRASFSELVLLLEPFMSSKT
ncbi:uncharacterized protein LOC142576301 [Dermacentor variabilis]|uniref:uncharacterized protein LOC142576301 n=1 Tax=Dermacentor variabilis TaxID=34621 RepID=UPI003F5B8747